MVTASIVVHNTPILQLEKAIDCLLESDVKTIYVIDNSPTDKISRLITKDPRIIYRYVENKGFGAGHNIALREVLKKNTGHHDYHLVMNADVSWQTDVITSLCDYMDSHDEVGMVMPKVFYPDGDLQYTCRLLPTPIDLFLKRFIPKRFTKRSMDRYLLAAHDHDKELNCPYLLGSFLFFRNEALKDCGIFDERFFMYPEDIDITRRLHENWKTMYWPGVSIIHEHAAASRKSWKMLKIHFENMIRYFNKWGWIYDKKRRQFNRRLLSEISYIAPEDRPSARG